MSLEPHATPTDLSLETIVLFVSDMMASRSFYEHALGLRALAADRHAATYSAGHVQLCLLPAAEHGVTLQEGRDRSADITFMVGDFARTQSVLAARGVRFSRTLEYAVGVTADFYDPDGHWFSLYQASEASMGWPSGPKLQSLAAAVSGDDLADAVIPYIFLFFGDPDAPADFYGGVLQLEAIEGGPCRRVPSNVESGVVKYDAGTTMLTTHHVDSDDKRFRVATTGTTGIALAFQVADLTMATAALSRRGVELSDRPPASPLGTVARFVDPAGHVLLLRERARTGEARVHAGVTAGAALER